MIPYLEIPTLHLGPLEIHAFGVLVAIGILVGADRTQHRAKQLGLPASPTSSMITWIVVCGFIMGHVFDVVAYQTNALRMRPPLEALLLLVDVRAGLSSFGGFLGALLSLLWWTRRHKYPLLGAADSLLYGLAFGWLLGRLGCFTAHDHPGAFTNFFLGVRYPDGTRHDLGLDEALFALVLAVSFALLSRRPQRRGLYAAIACTFYGPVRFALDFLRVHDLAGADPRYFGLTPAQYGSIAVFVTGIAIAVRVVRREGASEAGPAGPAGPASEARRTVPEDDVGAR